MESKDSKGLEFGRDFFRQNITRGGNFMLHQLLASLLGIILVGGLLIQPALGQGEYPTKPIEIIAPYTPGSAGDMTPRLVAETAKKYLGQPFIVINKPGAGGGIAAADVISSKPDGYKVVFLYDMLFITTSKTTKLPYPVNDLEPLANFTQTKLLLFVKGDSPWKTLNDLLDYGKKNPGKIRWATVGRGISSHIDMLSLFKKAGVEAIHISYPGTPEMMAALLGGHIDAADMVYAVSKDQMRAGALRALVAFNNKRFSGLPEIPTALELGFPDSSMLPVLGGLYIHKNTPEKIKRTLMDVLKKVSEDVEFKKGIENLGEELVTGGPEFVKDAIKKGERTAVPILKELGLYIGE
jgi:tripartite-type tricarboxylate transporter receptor subunit TctC